MAFLWSDVAGTAINQQKVCGTTSNTWYLAGKTGSQGWKNIFFDPQNYFFQKLITYVSVRPLVLYGFLWSDVAGTAINRHKVCGTASNTWYLAGKTGSQGWRRLHQALDMNMY